jgi:hypothetical protein
VENSEAQGCQIFLATIYQNGEKHTKLPQNYQMAIKYNKWLEYIPGGHKIPMPTFSISRPTKIYPN